MMWARPIGALAPDGGLIVVGSSDSDFLTRKFGVDLLRVDAAGNTLWQRYIQQPKKTRFAGQNGMWTSAAAVTAKGEIVVSGAGHMWQGLCEFPFLFRFDLDGKMVEGFEQDF